MSLFSRQRAGVPPFAGGLPEPDEEIEVRHAPELERQLLRHGVLNMSAGRCLCSECGRSPLVGERLQVFAGRHGAERAFCDLCLSEAGGPPGEPLRMERVRPGERPLTILRAA
jgi:hypothetical protein